jgi:hypothetical protein
MKCIINSKRYDTETAQRIAAWDSRHPVTDFHHEEESLYRTAGGNWFLHWEGGPLSSRRLCVGREYHPNNGITPLSEPEVLAWLERCNLPDIVEKWFPSHIQDA